MEKTLEILERYVQWIVLGIGVLFLAWSGYHYILTPPAQVKIGTRVAVAGEVTPLTNVGPVKNIKTALADSTNPGFMTPDIVQSWQSRMDSPAGGVSLAWAWNSPIPAAVSGIVPEGGTTLHVATVPVLPKADPQPPVTGLSVVTLTVPPAIPAPVAAAGAPAVPATPVAAQTGDLDWVTASASIPADALSKAFGKPIAGQDVPPALLAIYNTTLLQVTLQRQESTGTDANGQPTFPDGETGVEQVPPLSGYNDQIKPLPPETATSQDKYEYLAWARQNPILIGTPVFYMVTLGTPWVPPTPAAATQPAAGPAAAPVVGRPPLMPRGFHALQPAPGVLQPDMTSVPAYTPAADGSIDALNLNTNILIYAHDETIKPGGTYRYRFIYTMKNPLFGVAGMADPKLVERLTIVSPPSDWSTPVTTAETTKFWLAGINQSQAKFDVFQWTNGAWKSTKPTLTPGDLVPGTNWTLVDVRAADVNHQRDKYVLLTNEVADMSRHDQTADASDPNHQALIAEVAAPLAPGAAPAPGNVVDPVAPRPGPVGRFPGGRRPPVQPR